MFSFFTKKAQNPDNPVVIQGPEQQQNADDFIFIEKKGDQPVQPPSQQPMYPPMPPAGSFNTPYPRYPYGPQHPAAGSGPTKNVVQTPVPYVQDVPFVLAPQLCTKTAFENTQTQVDGILAFLTRQLSMDGEEEYNFALERSIQNECY